MTTTTARRTATTQGGREAALGAQVVAAELISPRITDVTAPLLNIRAANPDVIISTAYPAPGGADRAEVRRVRHD